jgi:CheY-like chemotaxis protein/HPt (histidine-containing phosphotransfer) domain-containing protein
MEEDALSECSASHRPSVDTNGLVSYAPVLIAEDDPVNRLIAARLLERAGREPDVACDGREAVKLLRRRAYGLILMDCQMPDLNGYRATRLIRHHEEGFKRHTPIVAMTAHAMSGEREKCLACGMDDYICKPLRPAEIDRVLERFAAGDPVQPPLLDHEIVAEILAGGGAEEGLVALFLRESRRRLRELGLAIAAGDTASVAEIAHKITGGCATFGAARMAATAASVCTPDDPAALPHASQMHRDLERLMPQTEKALLDAAALSLEPQTLAAAPG